MIFVFYLAKGIIVFIRNAWILGCSSFRALALFAAMVGILLAVSTSSVTDFLGQIFLHWKTCSQANQEMKVIMKNSTIGHPNPVH